MCEEVQRLKRHLREFVGPFVYPLIDKLAEAAYADGMLSGANETDHVSAGVHELPFSALGESNQGERIPRDAGARNSKDIARELLEVVPPYYQHLVHELRVTANGEAADSLVEDRDRRTAALIEQFPAWRSVIANVAAAITDYTHKGRDDGGGFFELQYSLN